MARTAVKRSTLPDLDRFLIGRQRHFVSYLDGARLYDLSYHTFVTLAKAANANLRVKKTVIVDIGIIEDYLAANPDEAEYYNALREVSPSTLSRLINQKTAGAVTDKLIAEIAAHADPDSGVTFEELVEAHGLALKDKRYRSESAFEETCHRIIEEELRIRGYTVEDAATEKLVGAGFGLRYDFALKTDALNSGNGKWYFDCKMFLGGTGVAPVGAGRTMQLLTMTMSLYYCGVIDAERVSIVVDRREIFEHLKRRCEGISIPDELSIILVDIHGMRVADEYVLNKKVGTGVTVFNDIIGTGEDKMDYAWDMSVFNEG